MQRFHCCVRLQQWPSLHYKILTGGNINIYIYIYCFILINVTVACDGVCIDSVGLLVKKEMKIKGGEQRRQQTE